MGSEPINQDTTKIGASGGLETGIGIARTTLRAILFCAIAAWVAGVPMMLRVLVFDEQFILTMIGIAATLVYLNERPVPQPLLRLLDIAFAVFTLAVYGYVALVLFPKLMNMVIKPSYVVWVSAAMLVTVLEATRRKTGPVLPILILVLVAFFTFIGPELPLAFQTRPLSFTRHVPAFALDNIAMLGRIMNIVGLVVVPFIVFGFLLNKFGGGIFFTGLATKLVGRFRGGPAKVSVVGSAAFGMVSGSAVANVVAVGAVSIPLMARTGYRRHVAAAIEAVTSTGGQLMPPIMGASAFLMAEFLEIPYREIVVAAIMPALFFYIALFMAVDFEARRLNILPSSPESLGLTSGAGWVAGWPYLLPVGVLLYLLFVEGRTAGYAGYNTVLAIMAVHLFWPSRKRARNGGAGGLISAVLGALASRVGVLIKETLNCMGVCTEIILLGATAGIIIGLLHKTGFASAVTIQMVILSQGQLPVLLLFTALLGIILGMGMPTVGVYILLAILAAPALIEIGVAPLGAHLYVLYFGMLSMITPPVAIASFAAASIAETNPWKTSFSSMRIGAGVYLVPVAFVTQPALLFDGSMADTAVAAARLLVAVTLFSAVFIGYAKRRMPLVLRIGATPFAVANVLPMTGGATDNYLWAALVISIVLFAIHMTGGKKDPENTETLVAKEAASD